MYIRQFIAPTKEVPSGAFEISQDVLTALSPKEIATEINWHLLDYRRDQMRKPAPTCSVHKTVQFAFMIHSNAEKNGIYITVLKAPD
jgi:hypothetical protein